jgi:adenylate cyclase
MTGALLLPWRNFYDSCRAIILFMVRYCKILLLLLLLCALSACAPVSASPPQATAGVLDLTGWNFDRDGLASLNGEWELYWGQLLTPQDFANSGSPQATGYFSVPQAWQGVKVGNITLPATGFSTVRLRIRLPQRDEPYAVYLKVEKMAWRAWLNGREVANHGVVGTSSETTAAANTTEKVNFQLQSGQEVDLIIQVANYHYAIGGMRNTMLVGPVSMLDNRIVRSIGFDIFLFGAFVAIALYHISLFALRPSDISPLYVTAFTLCIGFWRLMQGEAVFSIFFPQVPGDILIRIELICAFTLPMAIGAFIHSLFPDEWPRGTSQGIGIVFGSLVASAVFLPTAWSSQGLTIFRIALPVIAVVLIWVIIRALIHRRSGALLIFISGLLLAITALLDTLVVMMNQGWQVTSVLFPLGFLGMALVESFLLSRRSARAYVTVETQTKRLSELISAYYRFVPQALLDLIGKKDINDIRLGDQIEREMSVMFVDIRGFTALAENMTPAQVFAFLDSVLGGLAPIIRQRGGFVDKYLGDGFIALFPGSVKDALQAGIDIRRYMGTLNCARDEQGLRMLDITIALHAGRLILGTVGEPERMDGTVIGDAVNTTSRLEELAKRYNTTYLISETICRGLTNREDYGIRHFGEFALRGRRELLDIYEVFDGDPEEIAALKRETCDYFDQALRLFRNRDFEEANAHFVQLQKTNPNDMLIMYYETISRHFSINGVPQHWDGVQLAPEN